MNEGGITNVEKGRSPFSPGRPVPRDLFVGRKPQIDRMLRSAKQVSLGKQENLFITGEYGIGKSSLVSFIRFAAEELHDVVGFHVLLGGTRDIEGMVQQVVSRIIQQAYQGKMLETLKGVLGRYIQEVDLFGVKINTQALQRDVPQIAQDFLPFLRKVWKSLKTKYRGIALYLDDLNGITPSPNFAALIKSIVDEIATGDEELPLLLTLAGVPERRLEILANQPSVERILDIVELNPLEDSEVSQFFEQAFAAANITIDSESLDVLCHYSGGLPKLMHELGDAVFWEDQDGVVDRIDAVKGVVEAAKIVGRKYFEPISRALQSTDYKSILRKLGRLGFPELSLSFRKADLAKGLNETEKRKLSNFLHRMKKLNALHSGETRGTYVFPNRLVAFYLVLESGAIRRS